MSNALMFTPIVILPAGTYSGNFTSTPLDIRDFQGPIQVVADYGNPMAGGAATLNLHIASGGTVTGDFASVTGAGTFAQATLAGSQTLGIQTDAYNTHIRVVGSVGGSGRYPLAVHGFGLKQNA